MGMSARSIEDCGRGFQDAHPAASDSEIVASYVYATRDEAGQDFTGLYVQYFDSECACVNVFFLMENWALQPTFFSHG